MKGVHIFLADGFEDMEALATRDVLLRGGIPVITVSITDEYLVESSHGLQVTADTSWGDLEVMEPGTDASDVMIIPGGMPGSRNLAQHAELMENDRAKHNVLPLTKFGLMQITRQRIRPVTEINTSEQCPVCHGTGKIHSSVVIDEEIERKIAFYVIEKGVRSLTLKTSPILGAYLKRGLFNSFLTRWRKRYKVKLELQEVTEFSVLQNELFNEKGDKLE